MMVFLFLYDGGEVISEFPVKFRPLEKLLYSMGNWKRYFSQNFVEMGTSVQLVHSPGEDIRAVRSKAIYQSRMMGCNAQG